MKNKIIKILLLAILILLAWHPGTSESYNPSRSAYALATDQFSSSGLGSQFPTCGFSVHWAPFGRLVTGNCGVNYFVTYFGAFQL